MEKKKYETIEINFQWIKNGQKSGDVLLSSGDPTDFDGDVTEPWIWDNIVF